jgi:hypothetical protein
MGATRSTKGKGVDQPITGMLQSRSSPVLGIGFCMLPRGTTSSRLHAASTATANPVSYAMGNTHPSSVIHDLQNVNFTNMTSTFANSAASLKVA